MKSVVPLLNALNVGIISLRDDLTIIDLNKWVETYTPFDRKEAKGQNFAHLFGLNPVEAKKLERKINTALTLKNPTFYRAEVDNYLFPIPTVRMTKTHFPYMRQDVTIVPIEDEPQCVNLIIYDQTPLLESYRTINQQKHELSVMNENLERLVEHEIEKRRKQEVLLAQQTKMAAMGEMIGAIAHQWRQPLTTLDLYFQEIADSFMYGELTEQLVNDLTRKARHHIEFLNRTMSDFQNFFNPHIINEHFTVRTSLDSVLNLLSAKFSRMSVEVIIREKSDVYIYGNSNEFKQVLLNILSNAKDALDERKPENPEISISISRINEQGIIQIEDNAGGIPEGILEHIFDPYLTTKGEKGTGIGLYISKMVIEKMAGTLTVNNSSKGAVFTITLPLSF